MRLFAAPKDCHQLSAAGLTFEVDENGHVDLTGTPQAVIDLLTQFAGVTPVQDDGPATDPVNDPVATGTATGTETGGETGNPETSSEEDEENADEATGTETGTPAANPDTPLQLAPGALRPAKKAKKA